MNVLVTGATGFIGSALVEALLARGDHVVAVGRDAARARAKLGERVEAVAWDPSREDGLDPAVLARVDAVVNLASEPIMARRWNEAFKRRIMESRVQGTRTLVRAIGMASKRPKVLVNASADGFYGDTGDRTVDEASPRGHDFLADVCVAWEGESERARALGVREVRVRISVVLGERGGALAQMQTPFKLFVGGPIGSGEQWMSWIHIDDLVAVLLRAIDDDRLEGPVNACAPEPVKMRAFAKVLGDALGRPSWAPVPGFALRLAVGEVAEVVLGSKRCVPTRLKSAGFTYRYPDLPSALRAATHAH